MAPGSGKTPEAPSLPRAAASGTDVGTGGSRQQAERAAPGARGAGTCSPRYPASATGVPPGGQLACQGRGWCGVCSVQRPWHKPERAQHDRPHASALESLGRTLLGMRG